MPQHDPTSLENLHGIVEPEAVSLWWPLATGWWVAVAFVLVASVLAAWRVNSLRRRNAYRRAALAELEDGNAAGLPTLLKRVALSAYPRTEVAGLTGDDWIAFLNREAPRCFDEAAARELLHLSYAPESAPESDGETSDRLTDACRRWIADHRPSKEAAA